MLPSSALFMVDSPLYVYQQSSLFCWSAKDIISQFNNDKKCFVPHMPIQHYFSKLSHFFRNEFFFLFSTLKWAQTVSFRLKWSLAFLMIMGRKSERQQIAAFMGTEIEFQIPKSLSSFLAPFLDLKRCGFSLKVPEREREWASSLSCVYVCVKTVR